MVDHLPANAKSTVYGHPEISTATLVSLQSPKVMGASEDIEDALDRATEWAGDAGLQDGECLWGSRPVIYEKLPPRERSVRYLIIVVVVVKHILNYKNLHTVEQGNFFEAPVEPIPSAQTSTSLPGPLIMSDSAITIWNVASATAQDRLQNYRSVLPPDPIQTTMEERCWLTLMALQKEHELQDCFRKIDQAWRELEEVRRVLGIDRT
ncbi:hypothetical protein C8R48DRAFT_669333 [Suillus tomentosus]|nr:hypothetical protein C8R48DRAFT_669333 [Suillus tomentosus]